MLKHILVALALVVLAGGPAQAFHCPADMAKIDAALAADPKLSPEQLEEVKALRSAGEALHNVGDHAQSVQVLARAMTILGIH